VLVLSAPCCKEEYRIDGAKAFVDMVADLRRKSVKNVMFFLGSAVEPQLQFEVEQEEPAEAPAAEAGHFTCPFLTSTSEKIVIDATQTPC
jgi:hypothetical protein